MPFVNDVKEAEIRIAVTENSIRKINAIFSILYLGVTTDKIIDIIRVKKVVK
jgi:hypothetical protein